MISTINEYFHECQIEDPCSDPVLPMIANNDENESSTTTISLNEVNLFPNPATSEINLQFELRNASEINVEIYKADGKLMTQLFIYGEKGMNTTILEIGTLRAGMYYLVTRFPNHIETRRFVKSDVN